MPLKLLRDLVDLKPLMPNSRCRMICLLEVELCSLVYLKLHLPRGRKVGQQAASSSSSVEMDTVKRRQAFQRDEMEKHMKVFHQPHSCPCGVVLEKEAMVDDAIWAAEKAVSKTESECKEVKILMEELKLKPQLVSFKAWVWASATVSSRTMHIAWDDAGCLCPVGDLFNYAAPVEESNGFGDVEGCALFLGGESSFWVFVCKHFYLSDLLTLSCLQVSSRTMHIAWNDAGCLCPVGDLFNYAAPGEESNGFGDVEDCALFLGEESSFWVFVCKHFYLYVLDMLVG